MSWPTRFEEDSVQPVHRGASAKNPSIAQAVRRRRPSNTPMLT